MPDRFDEMPKVELQPEGAIPYSALLELARKYGSAEVTSLESIEERFRYRDFAHFIEAWVWKNGFLREPDGFRLIAEAVARGLEEQNVLYAEIFYSPPDFAKVGLGVQEIREAVRAGPDLVKGLRIGLVVARVVPGRPSTVASPVRTEPGLGPPAFGA